MNFKLMELKKAIEYLRYTGGVPDDAEVDISFREEDFEKGKICSSVTFTAAYTKESVSYDSVKTPKTISIIVEIFPSSENRPPRITKQESQVLEG